jgi:hypothetical protein
VLGAWLLAWIAANELRRPIADRQTDALRA